MIDLCKLMNVMHDQMRNAWWSADLGGIGDDRRCRFSSVTKTIIFRELTICEEVLKVDYLILPSPFSKHCYFFLCVCACIFRAVPMTYRCSQDRGQIRNVAAGLLHSSRQCWIPDPLSEVRDWTCVLMDTSQVYYTEPQWELHKYCYSWFSYEIYYESIFGWRKE